MNARRFVVHIAGVLGVCLAPAVALAQVVPSPGRIEVAAGGGLLGGAALGDAEATLRGRGDDPFRLFTTESRFDAAPSIEIRGAYALTPRYAIEGRAEMSRPVLRTSVSADVEGAPPLVVTERVDQYVIDGALVVRLERFSFAGLTPFAAAGAGYLRQLHEGQTLVEEGAVVQLGGGVRRAFFERQQRWLKGAGVRADARVYLFAGGISHDDGPRPHLGLSAGVFFGF